MTEANSRLLNVKKKRKNSFKDAETAFIVKFNKELNK